MPLMHAGTADYPRLSHISRPAAAGRVRAGAGAGASLACRPTAPAVPRNQERGVQGIMSCFASGDSYAMGDLVDRTAETLPFWFRRQRGMRPLHGR